MRRFWTLAACMFVLSGLTLVVPGCGGGSLGDDTVDALADADAAETANPDTEDGTTEDSGETGEGDAVEAIEPPPVTTCVADLDCEEGPCLETPVGKRCAKACSEEVPCDTGFGCVVIGEETGVCMSHFTALCRPCGSDGDCDNNGEDLGSFCRSFGDSGSFCVLECPADGCPDGYACDSDAGLDICLPQGGECGCNASAIASGAATSCAIATDAGLCVGTRACGPGGLTACSAAIPIPEMCDAQDNNCDGATDEGFEGLSCLVENENGVCVGARSCTDGAWICGAATPAAEACDGQDNDCDGAVDEANAEGCADWNIDTDQDGFGTAETACLCAPAGWYTAGNDLDCDDSDPLAQPELVEFCDGRDNDCDGVTDEIDAFGCQIYFRDDDSDDYGVADDSICLCASEAPYDAVQVGDCDDGNEAIFPGAVEVCNEVDDDCDGNTDVWIDGSCWASPDSTFRRAMTLNGNLTGRILKDVQVPVDFTNLTYDNTDLQLSLHFNEGSGGVVGDSSGKENHGSFLQAAAWEFGKESNALKFDGQNDCVKIPKAPSLMIEDRVSLLLWFKWDGGNTRQALISRSDECASEGSYNLYLENGNLHLSYGVQGSLKTVWQLSDAVTQNQWKHLGVTLRYTTGEVMAWLDGEALTPTLLEGTAGGDALTVPGDVYLGCRWMHHTGSGCPNIGARDYFDGTVDEVRVYSRILEAPEVLQFMNRDRGMYNVGDIRFTQDFSVRLLEIAISEIGGASLDDVQLKITLDDQEVLANITRDARDLRIYPTPTVQPYGETYTGLPFWVERRGLDGVDIWVRVSPDANDTKKLFLYYGNPDARQEASFDAVFTKDPDGDSDDLLIEYHFDETGGQTAQDDSGNAVNGTLANVSYVNSDGGQWGEHRDIRFAAGNSLLFNGTNSHVVWSWPDGQFVLPQSDFSFEMWFLPTAPDCGLFHVESQESALTIGDAIYMKDSKVFFQFDGSTFVATDKRVVLDEWHHLIVTVDSFAGTRIFVDGKVEATSQVKESPFFVEKAKGHLGFTVASNGAPYFKGNLDEFRMLSRPISADEAVARYHRSHWHFPTPQIDFGSPVVIEMGAADLDHWVASDRNVWVEVPFVTPSVESELHLYYGNVSAYPRSSFSATFTKDPDAPDDAGLLAEWHLDTEKGNWMYDDSDGAHDGLLWNFTWGASDGGGWAARTDVAFDEGSHLVFNGETSFVELRYDDSLNPGEAYSVEFWIQWDGPKGNVDEQQFLHKGDAYGFAVGNGGLEQGHLLYHFLDASHPTEWTSSGIVFEPGVWTHVALTHDNYNIKLFQDGHLIRTEPFHGQAGIGASDQLMFGAGGSPSSPQDYFFGKLDEIKMYSRTLHPVEVKAHAFRHQYVLPPLDVAIGAEAAL